MQFVVVNQSKLGFWLTLIIRQELGEEGPENTLLVLSSLREIDPESLRAGEIVFSEYLATGDLKTSDDVPDCETSMELMALGNMPRLVVQSLMTENLAGLLLMLRIQDQETPPVPLDGPLTVQDSSERPNEIVVRNHMPIPVIVTVLEGDPGISPPPDTDLAPRIISIIVSAEKIPPENYEGSVLRLEHELSPGDKLVFDDLHDVGRLFVIEQRGLCELDENTHTKDGWTTHEIDILPMEGSDPDWGPEPTE